MGGRSSRAAPGLHGYERFPYLPQALLDLGLSPPFRSTGAVGLLRLFPIAFVWTWITSPPNGALPVFPGSARRGVALLGTRSRVGDEYLRHLIEACHRNAILVYAWFELPHVSDKILGPASGVAREDRARARRPARLAQAHEPVPSPDL